MHVKLITDNSNRDKSVKLGDFYNEEFLRNPRSDIYGFLTEKDIFYNNESIQKIVHEFVKNPEVGVVYFDKYLKKDNNLIVQIYPSYEYQEPVVYNPTIFLNGKINFPIFNPSLEGLLFYDVIQKLGQACRVVHIPEILMISEFSHTNIDKELENYVRTNI